MRLVSLTANKRSFRSLSFNSEGLSVIASEGEAADKRSAKHTYNGVGKSLSIELISFCLGSSKRKVFAKHLESWVFKLTVEIDNRHFTISRACGGSQAIELAGQKVSLKALRNFLNTACQPSSSEEHLLTFRLLLSGFLRSSRGGYDDFYYASPKERIKPYWVQLRHLQLLGLSKMLAEKKYHLVKRAQDLSSTLNRIRRDPTFKDVLEGDDAGAELAYLSEEADELQRSLDAYEVADNFRSIEREANHAKSELNEVRREIILTENQIGQVQRSLQLKLDLSWQEVKKIYDEVELKLPEEVVRQLTEVHSFHRALKIRRLSRLQQDQERLTRRLVDLRDREQRFGDILDAKLQYLGTHRALDEYVALSEKLRSVRSRIVKIEESAGLADKVEKEINRIERDISVSDVEADDYLEDAAPNVRPAIDLFRELTRRLYGRRPSRLSLKNRTGVNQLRFDVEAHIKADAAHGINEAKIFCYDLTLLLLQNNHRIGFLYHDSSLFSSVDPRQRLAMLNAASELCENAGLQYICNLNLHDIDGMADRAQASEGETSFPVDDQAVIISLSGTSPKQKLLGVDLDMDYHT